MNYCYFYYDIYTPFSKTDKYYDADCIHIPNSHKLIKLFKFSLVIYKGYQGFFIHNHIIQRLYKKTSKKPIKTIEKRLFF